jgi:hypothetical protein
VAKRILAVALFLGLTLADRYGSKESVAFFSDDGGIVLGPRGLFIVSKDHDATFCTNWIPKFIRLDGLNNHGGENGDGRVLREPDGLSDGVIGAMVNECGMFFNIGLGPDGLIGIHCVHRLAEGIGDAASKFTSGDMLGTRRGGHPNSRVPSRMRLRQVVGRSLRSWWY